ncbi:DUF397 domain-containing protein [Nocardia sp. NPDC024068]|uniref:DUF397 domain-containing protein n=1 Tax=Nocardia sp. NPDC024068 TaxID=3157197 RepID=UPI0033DB975B
MSAELAGAKWFKSSHSGGQTDCVEVAWLPSGRVGVRDSKNPESSVLAFSSEAWTGLIAVVRGGATPSA